MGMTAYLRYNELMDLSIATPQVFQGRKKIVRWGSVIFIGAVTMTALVAAPLYIYQFGVSRSEIILFAVYFIATSLAITVGYHRYFAHSTFKTNPVIRFVLLFFGAATFEQSALKWSSLHRVHHQYTDTERDPYNIKDGFFYAHVGWILFWKQPVNYDNVKDLLKSRLIKHQHEHYQFWALTSGILIPLLLGAWTGHLLGALIFAVGLRLFLVFNSAFFINSFAHTFGSRPYDPFVSARDHWLGAILTNGEGYHNYHHRFPNDYRNGIQWYHWDPSKWIIWTLEKIGMARDLRRTPREQIIKTRQEAEMSLMTIE